jgi:alpha-tubulin suppressor-like RCC1 family protein
MGGALASKTVIAIAAGSYHSLALTSDGRIYSWGRYNEGQLGNNSVTNQPTPVAVDMSGALAGKTVIAIAAGFYHSLALTSDGQVYSWGYDNSGQLGDDPTIANQPTPVPVDMSGALSGKIVTAVDACGYDSLALTSDGKVYSWGSDSYGQLGDNGANTNQPTPVAVDMSGVLYGKAVTTIAAGDQHSLALTSDGKVYSWGQDIYGQLGNDAVATNQPTPVAVDMSGALTDKTITAISAGAYHSLALADDNKVYSWGDDYYGGLGNDSATTEQRTPVAVDMSGILAGKTVTAILAGADHSLALTSDGKVYGWGRDSSGQLGNDAIIMNRPTPVAVDMTTSALKPFDFTITFDPTGAPAPCRDLETGANNITTNIALDGTSVRCITSAHSAGTVDVAVNNGIGIIVKDDFYAYIEPYLNLAIDQTEVLITDDNGTTDTDGKINPTLIGTFAQGSNVLTTTTNSPHGYSLSLSTNQPSSASNPSDMHHQSLPGNYLLATDKTCTWNDTDKSLNTPDPLPNNTYGFTLDSTNLSSQKLCRVPNSTSPLTVKSTTNADETGDATTIYYGAKIDTRQLAGQYKTTIVYTAVGNV